MICHLSLLQWQSTEDNYWGTYLWITNILMYCGHDHVTIYSVFFSLSFLGPNSSHVTMNYIAEIDEKNSVS